jgi:hypothetical protein
MRQYGLPFGQELSMFGIHPGGGCCVFTALAVVSCWEYMLARCWPCAAALKC